ncbi:MAG: DHH family phosphoesterase [Clostridia bacterium]|nr:DHH family phosphoesterase [Clostridia bacterium]
MKQTSYNKFRAGAFFACTLVLLILFSAIVVAMDARFLVLCGCLVALFVLVFVLFSLAASRSARRARGEGEMTQSVSMDFLHAFSLPTLLLGEEGQIQWCNEAFSTLVGEGASAIYGENFNRFLPADLPVNAFEKHEGGEIAVNVSGTSFDLLPHATAGGSYICVLIDQSEREFLQNELARKNPAVLFLAVDNVSDDPAMSGAGYRTVLSRIYPLLEEWAQSLSGIVREFGRDRYLVVLEEEKLEQVRESKFEILDRVRALSDGVVEIPVTVSAGVAYLDGTLHEKELASYQALDMALQRGGDQAVFKDRDGTLEYFGGRTKTVQRRSRIKSRIIAGQLKNLVLASERVIVMGHANADHDSIGACVGLARFCMELGRPVNIVANPGDVNLKPILKTLSALPEYADVFLDAASAQDLVSPSTLLIVADVNNVRTFESAALYENSQNVVVIDHHRKSDEFIVTPKIAYIDPACSSTCEMVSEILEQSLSRGKLQKEEAEILFAGIMLDTKQFTRNTGTRTFAAAQFLRDADANPTQAQRLFSTNLETMLSELDFEKNVVIYRDVIAIAASDKPARLADKIAASRAADRLLNLENVQATFVLCRIDDCTHISARSAGKVNVQLILERLHGGGYFDAAGAQLKGLDFTGALELLKESIDEYLNVDL